MVRQPQYKILLCLLKDLLLMHVCNGVTDTSGSLMLADMFVFMLKEIIINVNFVESSLCRLH